jgi:hypothetical protein
VCVKVKKYLFQYIGFAMFDFSKLSPTLKNLSVQDQYNFNGVTTGSENFLLGTLTSYDYLYDTQKEYVTTNVKTLDEQIKYLELDDVFGYHDSIQGKNSAFKHLDKREMTQVVLEYYETKPSSVDKNSNIINTLLTDFGNIPDLSEDEKNRLIFNALLLHDANTDTNTGNGTDAVYGGWRSNNKSWEDKLSKISQADIDSFATKYGLDVGLTNGLTDLVEFNNGDSVTL